MQSTWNHKWRRLGLKFCSDQTCDAMDQIALTAEKLEGTAKGRQWGLMGLKILGWPISNLGAGMTFGLILSYRSLTVNSLLDFKHSIQARRFQVSKLQEGISQPSGFSRKLCPAEELISVPTQESPASSWFSQHSEDWVLLFRFKNKCLNSQLMVFISAIKKMAWQNTKAYRKAYRVGREAPRNHEDSMADRRAERLVFLGESLFNKVTDRELTACVWSEILRGIQGKGIEVDHGRWNLLAAETAKWSLLRWTNGKKLFNLLVETFFPYLWIEYCHSANQAGLLIWKTLVPNVDLLLRRPSSLRESIW